MADSTDPDSAPSSSSDGGADEYVEQWNALCEELGTSDPNEVLARVQTLKRKVDRGEAPTESASESEGLVTISEVEEVFREMNKKIEKLRERNAALADRLGSEGDETNGMFQDLHQKTEEILVALDVSTIDEAREQIETLQGRLDDLYREKETLVQAGLSDAAEAVTELDRLRDERDALREERNQLQAERDQLEDTLEEERAASPAGPDTSVMETAVVMRDRLGITSPDQAEALTKIVEQVHGRLRSWAEGYDVEVDDTPSTMVELLRDITGVLDALPAPPAPGSAAGDENASEDEGLPAAIGDILDVRTAEEARELSQRLDEQSTQLDRLRREHEKLEEEGLTVDAALTMIESMSAQLASLYHRTDSPNGVPPAFELDDALTRRIVDLTGIDPDHTDDLPTVVEALVDELDRLAAAYRPLEEAGLDPEEAVAQIENEDSQPDDSAPSTETAPPDAADRLAAIEDVLGISTRREAEELSQLAHQMEEQLKILYQEKEKLQDLGVNSIEDAVEMIKSMEDQLADLYDDKEALRKVQASGTENQSTFQQLEDLYAERERLQQALGVSGADEIIEMVESLNTQLEDLYEGRDAEVDPEDRAEARLWAPEAEPAASEESDPTTAALSSMEYQLEALYREKETLLHHGFNNVQEAVTQLQTQQKQIDFLQRENHTYERQFDQLKSGIGTANPDHLIELVDTLASEADRSPEEVLDTTSGPSEVPDYGVDIEAASPFVDDDTLDRLDDMTPAELNALDVGVMRLDEEGTVEVLNEAALQLPGLQSIDVPSEVVGQNFFLDVAPSTNNNLFFGRFENGQRRGAMDARFPYTFVSPDEGPQSFAVHLHRKPDGDATWLLFRPT